jgi:predicted metal-binding protein
MTDKRPLRTVELRRPGPVLVCRKCLKRKTGGGKLKQRLKAGLQEHSEGQRKRRSRLVLTNCLGICPKEAAVAFSPAAFARGEVVLIGDSSKAAIEQALKKLL